MVVVKGVVPDEVGERFRKTAMRRFGYSKGALSEAMTSALDMWADEEVIRTEADENPVDAIEGLLSYVKMSSVELQKEALKEWGERYDRHRRKRVP
ncbi:hypothetical protein HY641_02045 [Candidatus Woesearchaeota archaeon]|nr:hypothetical protein [Candidatus Woesearchaeota archaeon]